MSTSQRAVILYGWGVKAGMACLQVKLYVAISERFGNASISRRFTHVQVYLLSMQVLRCVAPQHRDHRLL